MKSQALLVAVAALALAGALTLADSAGAGDVKAGAGDVKSVPRTIAKQPAYSGTASYALLVFGPEAKQRVWMVTDASNLYVDKNGNGDLSEPAEKIALTGEPSVEDSETCKVTWTEFEVGDLPAAAGQEAYTGLYVSRTLRVVKPGAPADEKSADLVAISVNFRKGCSQSAMPTFAATPADAPVVHFDGPLIAMVAAGCEGPTAVLEHGNETQELTIQIGTQGVGASSWAPLAYDPLVPETVKPVLEIAFPPAKAGGAPVVTKYTLDERC